MKVEILQGLFLGALLPFLASLAPPLREENYRSEEIPLLGFLFPFLALYYLLGKDTTVALVLLSFGFLGLLDDAWGMKEVKGFGGHFALLLKGRFSTGWLKAVGGIVASLFIGYILYPNNPARILLSAFLISASANFLNLLDVRPGRCLKVFLILNLLAYLGGARISWFVLSFSLVYLLYDLREISMLGDAGSNSLGAVMGLYFAYSPLPVQLTYALFLVLMLFIGEFSSFTRIINGNRVLRFLDLLGRRRFTL